MPVQPNYSLPAFNPSGSTDISAAMGEWVQGFQTQYQKDQETISRATQIFSVFQSSQANNPAASYTTKTVQLMGGENVLVTGTFDFNLSAGGSFSTAGNSAAAEAAGKLKVTYPGGTVQTFSQGQSARLRVTWNGTKGSEFSTNSTATMSIQSSNKTRATVGFSWVVTPRYQTGGDHLFTLYTSGDGTVENATMNILLT